MTDRAGVRLFRVGKTEVRMTLWFPAVAAVLCLYGDDKTALCCLSASLMHECGHLIALICVKTYPQTICFGGFGMRILLPPQRKTSYLRQAIVALAGPFESGVATVLMHLIGSPKAAGIHLVLCIFNLLPIRPLDGGQALLFLLYRRVSRELAERVVAITSVAAVIPLTVIGVCLLFQSGYNASMLLVCVYLIFLLLFKTKD